MAHRFVILHHTGHGPEHWDLLLEEETAVLATWQCPANPCALPPGGSFLCRKLPDHRLAYLTYEGPVRRNRGRVRRTQEGEYELLASAENIRTVRLREEGGTFSAVLQLQPGPKDEEWILRRRE